MNEVVAALICRGERLMICQRPEGKAQALLWELAGGKVEPGKRKSMLWRANFARNWVWS